MTEPGSLSRRSLIVGTAALAGAAALAPRGASAQASPPANAQLGTPASTITTPPRDWSPGHPSIYPDPDVIVVDPSFRQFAPGNSGVRRLWTGAQWAEGPAWSSQGQYLVFRQHAIPLHLGGRPGHCIPPSVEQHQRQFIRFRGSPALLRGLQPSRRALGA